METLPPLPAADPATAYFWDGAREGKLMILRCNDCGTYIHLPRPICRGCQSFSLAPAEMSGRATLYSFTETFKAFHPYYVDKVPYILATVELAEQPGLMLLSNVVDVDHADVRIGMKLQVVFRPLGPDHAVPVFTAVNAEATEAAA
jgi:uncharacterized protein